MQVQQVEPNVRHPIAPRRQIPLSGRELSRAATNLYQGGPLLRRKLQHWRPLICPFERLLPHVPTGASVLDIGCGGGLFLGLLAQSGAAVDGLGFDVSAGPVEVAREMSRRFTDPSARLRFERRDPSAPFPDRTFDVVSMIDVLHHVSPARQRPFVLEACARVAPGGLLLYKDMCRRPRWRAAANRLHDLVLARQWIHYVPIEAVEQWGRAAGLEPVHGEYVTRLWYGHELRLFRRPGDAVRNAVVVEAVA